MKIGFIGSGDVAASIARRAIRAGHEVVLSSKSGTTASRLAEELGPLAASAPIQEAAHADIAILAVRWLAVADTLGEIADWNGRILVDATNAFIQYQPLILADLGEQTSSEIVADRAPGARIVKAFNSLPMTQFNDKTERDGAKRVLFVSGDDDPAKKIVAGFIASLGLATIDLGNLASGGRLQQAGGPLAGQELFLAH